MVYDIIMRKKTITILLIASLVGIAVYIGFLFLPYFRDVQKATGSVNRIVTGFQIGFGVKGRSDTRVIGNGFILIAQLAGMVSFPLTAIFTIWSVKHTKNNGFMYLLLCLSIACTALALSSMFLAWPVYQNLNSSKSYVAIFSWSYFVSIVAIGLALLINTFVLFLACYNQKTIINKE